MLQQGGDSSSLPASSSAADVNAAATAVAAAAAAIEGVHDGAGSGGVVEVGSNNSAGEEDSKARGDEVDRSFGGNRWPRQETLALLKIRSDMDQVFRDSSLKGPLWEEVSRKLAELGYNRSAKKCKEKFENVYKYHKRTKEGRTGKPEGKHYKFFDQLEALDHHHHHHHRSQSHNSVPQTKPQSPLMQASAAIPWSINPPSSVSHVNIPISPPNPISSVPQNTVTPPPTNPTIYATPLTQQAMNTYQSSLPSSFQNVAANLFSSSTSSSTASDEESEERETRKRKWKVFFKRLTKEVIKKQEELQNKFLEEIERRERDRIVREESWRIQEMARINREHDILIQERSTAAAKDAAVIAFLQNISRQQQNPVQTKGENLNPQPPPVQVQVIAALPPQPPPPAPPIVVKNYLEITPNKPANGKNVIMSSSSRWPKAEVQALIKLRTDLANKYQENGPKGSLWVEISAAMRSVGYHRSAKRCKEKWENINKYFKKVKESNKKRPEDSKTCPYFNQLDALYKEKNETENSVAAYGSIVKAVNHNMAPLMVQPEQQWPLHQQENRQQQSVMSDIERDNADQIPEDDEDTEEEYEEEEANNGDGYEIVANKPAASMESTE